jgi:predicted amidophosphoribosyltransferase
MTLPASFPGCRGCAHLSAGPARLCAACARPQLQLIPADSCPVCCQHLGRNGRCPNELCRNPRRRIGRIHAIGYQAGPLRQVINNYKYRGGSYWPAVFGRLVLAWLADAMAADRPDLIVANPSYVGPGGQLFAHTEAVVAAAAAEDGSWPFDRGMPAAIVKTAPTLRSADEPYWYKRFAAVDLGDTLRVPDPARTAGRFVLVYDDICTTGGQLDAVAGCLLDEGHAARVEGVVLARAPWRGTSRP